LPEVLSRSRMHDDSPALSGAFDPSHAKAVPFEPPANFRGTERDVKAAVGLFRHGLAPETSENLQNLNGPDRS